MAHRTSAVFGVTSETVNSHHRAFTYMEVRCPTKGTVKRWLTTRGYGFIEPDEGENDVFVHYSEIKGATELHEGQRVEFEVESAPKGPRAVNIRIIK